MVAQGTTLAGRYRLDTRIGAGGMGEVWRGEDIVLARTVAVKVLLPGRTEDPGFVARFQGEARAMATINHSGVVDVYDYGVSGDTVYLVMKFVDGEPLDRLLSRLGRIPPQPAMELIAQAASALQAVHDQGIVHRDVKPGNLLVQRDGTLVLTDFGIARSDMANRLTDAGMVLGTAAYCAPEQAEGAPVTPAVDIYALGVVAYECLVGQRPFDGDSAVTIALKHIRETPPPLPAEIPPAVRTLVEVALSKDPARRYPSARAMSEAARAIANGQTPAVPERALAPAPSTGTVPPVESYQTGMHQARPQEETTTVSDRRGGGRRAAKAPRRTGLIMGVAAAVVLGAGATAIALTGMTPGQVTVTEAPRGNGEIIIPETTAPPTKTHEPTDEPTKGPKPTYRPPTRDTDPEPTREPTKTPTSTPSVTKTPTNTPSGTPSSTPTPSVKKVRMPKVVGLPFLEAQERVQAAGFEDINAVDRTSTRNGMRCGKISETKPGAGTAWDVTKQVSIVVVDGVCPENSPSPSVSATPKS
ncbi:protein kinase [Nonomuraea phyllanthi]|uniref:serine/threonine-protein kinase n=1 Tax=Nonomuraea phyllanthi TaxID=2219224 RepID=UPI0012938916|nr:serine/threonine-protein kinase [Nonomuraea phyllanthi]QFY12585.1 protein kinase [Nonomuraea phyllanthi]